MRYLDRPTVALQPANVRDIAALKASFNNTYELGYKGIMGDRARLAVDLWYQQRGDVGAPASLATPNIFYDPQTLGAYLGANIAQRLITHSGYRRRRQWRSRTRQLRSSPRARHARR